MTELTLTVRAALVPVPRVLDLATGVVGGAQALSAVPPVLTHIPLPSAEHLDNCQDQVHLSTPVNACEVYLSL